MTTREQETLLDVLDDLDGVGHGVPIRKAISAKLGRDVSLSELYVALERLEEVGVVRSTETRGGAERSFRNKKHFWRA